MADTSRFQYPNDRAGNVIARPGQLASLERRVRGLHSDDPSLEVSHGSNGPSLRLRLIYAHIIGEAPGGYAADIFENGPSLPATLSNVTIYSPQWEMDGVAVAATAYWSGAATSPSAWATVFWDGEKWICLAVKMEWFTYSDGFVRLDYLANNYSASVGSHPANKVFFFGATSGGSLVLQDSGTGLYGYRQIGRIETDADGNVVTFFHFLDQPFPVLIGATTALSGGATQMRFYRGIYLGTW